GNGTLVLTGTYVAENPLAAEVVRTVNINMSDPVDDGPLCCSDTLSIIQIGAPGGPVALNMSASGTSSSFAWRHCLWRERELCGVRFVRERHFRSLSQSRPHRWCRFAGPDLGVRCSYGLGAPRSSARRLREVGTHSHRSPMSLQACWPSTVSTLLL